MTDFNGLHLGIDIEKSQNSGLEQFTQFCREVDFCSFIKPQISSLILGNNVWDMQLGMMIEDILHRFSSELVSLELYLIFERNDPALNLRRDDLLFPKLKILKDCSTSQFYGSNTEGDKGLAPFYTKLLQAVPELESLTITEAKNIFPAQPQNFLPKLKSLEITEELWESDLKLVANANWPLTSLSLDTKNFHPGTLQKLFDKYKPTLEHLTLGSIEGRIIIPSCPKMKSLAIFFDFVSYWNAAVDGDENEMGDAPGLQFMGNELENYFPDLEDLTVEILDGEGELLNLEGNQEVWFNHLRQVFPEESVQVFRGLRTLRIPRDWEAVEQDIRARFQPQIQIIYDDEEN